MKTIIAICLATLASMAMAHGGGTNSSGCHYERSTGGYHCH